MTSYIVLLAIAIALPSSSAIPLSARASNKIIFELQVHVRTGVYYTNFHAGDKSSWVSSWGSNAYPMLVDTGSSETWIAEEGYWARETLLGSKPLDLKQATDASKHDPVETLVAGYVDGSRVIAEYGSVNIYLTDTDDSWPIELAFATFIKDMDLEPMIGMLGLGAEGKRAGELGVPTATDMMGMPFQNFMEAAWHYQANMNELVPYTSVWKQICNIFVLPPVMGIGLDPDSGRGHLSIGAPLPPELGYHDDRQRTISNIDVDNNDGWTMQIQDLVWKSFPLGKTQVIEKSLINDLEGTRRGFLRTHFVTLDTGSEIVILPKYITDYWATTFSPPAVYDSTTESYVVDCVVSTSATFGVLVGKAWFPIPAHSIIRKEPNGKCHTLFTFHKKDEFQHLWILGVPFMENIAVVEYNHQAGKVAISPNQKGRSP